MKTLYFISGTMGIGKTTIGLELNKELTNSVYLDGDWCWMADPFIVNDETKKMVIRNIVNCLNEFLHCSIYENVIFTWVMPEQEIINDIINSLDLRNITTKNISLICSVNTLIKHLNKDIKDHKRTPDIIERSLTRLPLYNNLNTIKINIDDLTIKEIIQNIKEAE